MFYMENVLGPWFVEELIDILCFARKFYIWLDIILLHHLYVAFLKRNP